LHVIMNAALDTRMQWLTATFGTSVLLPWERTYLPCHLLESYRSIGTRACAKYFSFPTTRRPKQGLFMSVQNKDYSCLCKTRTIHVCAKQGLFMSVHCWQRWYCLLAHATAHLHVLLIMCLCAPNEALPQWRKVSSSRPQSPTDPMAQGI
jgi:hypothetical protein